MDIDYQVQRNGLNPLADIKTFFDFKRIFNQENPDIVLAYTIKPIIWGGLAARFSDVKNIYALVTGLGFAFQRGGLLKGVLMKVVKTLYRASLKETKGVIFQNPDNQQVFIENKLVDKVRCSLVNGSGVDLSRYEKTPLSKELNFLLIARLLGDKGIREYAQAAEVVKKKYPDATFNLVGPEDPSPDGISVDEVNSWHCSGVINYHGGTDDVRPYLEQSNVFVLPSYHEGMPRTVLEAMSMGRPILTTNVPSCKETVINGENGWLVEKANAEELAEGMIWFIENQGEWQRMGDKSHEMAIEKFDVHKVNQELLKIMGLDK
ncbi:MAG: glycosyltransferase involved in cell wall biosynthesis [Sediminicola sp.]|jgi:glycosyltransferase involved in cell wall biosynthesis